MMENYTELREKVDKEFREKKVKLVYTRTCSKPDKEGVKHILLTYPVSAIKLVRQIDGQVEENFYEVLDKEIAQEARQVLEKEWGLK